MSSSRPPVRTESGSLIASTFGIEAARQHLGHRNIRTTSSHYVEKKKRIEVRLPLGTSLFLMRLVDRGLASRLDDSPVASHI